MEQKKQIAYLQWLRLFAAGAVVLMHTAADRWMSIGHTDPRWEVLTWWDSLVRWPVPIFIMITGALFLSRRTALGKMLTGYIPRMVVCYLIWSAVYNIYEGECTPLTLASGYYHLWYLPFLWGVYLVLPFLQRIAEDDRLTDQLLGVGLVIGLGVPWMGKLLIFLLPDQTALVQKVVGQLNYTFFLDHITLLVLGHKLHQTELSPKLRRLIYVLGAAGVAVTGAATIWATRRAEFQNSIFFDFTAPNNLCAAVALFVFAKYNLTKLPKIVDRLAGLSFGIYLCHVLVIELLEDRGLHVLAFDPVWWTPVLAVLVFAIASLAAAVLRKIPGLGKYLA